MGLGRYMAPSRDPPSGGVDSPAAAFVERKTQPVVQKQSDLASEPQDFFLRSKHGEIVHVSQVSSRSQIIFHVVIEHSQIQVGQVLRGQRTDWESATFSAWIGMHNLS